jgi:predicted pyridoxine 5'-phosphate oxidase superfamily flavin-nucleotide-binding protein
MTNPSSDVAFSSTVKRIQTESGSRSAYRRMEERGGFRTKVDEDLREFLAEIDTAFLATASKDGQPYVQHRGGPRGFIRALDESTLAFADLAGNRQYVTTGNLLENDRVCLFLMDYAHRGRVKVWGHARIVPATPELISLLGEEVEHALLLTVTAWDGNCQQHIPQKLDAADVAKAIAQRDARIEELEAQLRKLKASS